MRYFTEYIERQSDLELYSVYADEGISGTSTSKRMQFSKMMNDAELGRFELIITKEVSRFSRNILDTIAYTRKLRSMGIGVLFMNDGICTLDPDAELRLSIMASIAQEESRRTSERVKWGQTRQMERGVVFGRSMLGYDVHDGAMTIEPEGAELVRKIFTMYGVEKMSTYAVANELRNMGYPSFSYSRVNKILKNEKYIGDLVQKKTYTPDYLTHRKKYNHGEEELIVIHGHHEPIIDRSLWDAVQSELRRRDLHGKSVGHSVRHAFSGKIFCGECGSVFVSMVKKRSDGTSQRCWRCSTASKHGKASCSVGMLLRDDEAEDMVRQIMSAMGIDMDKISAASIGAKRSENEIAKLNSKKESLIDAYLSGIIDHDEFEMMKSKYDKRISALQSKHTMKPAFHSGSIVCDMVDRITVYKDRHVEVGMKYIPKTFVFCEA